MTSPASPLPVLVLVGDDEPIPLSHTWRLGTESLPNGQLAVVPGTSHVVPREKADFFVNRLIGDFLAEEGPPVTFMPMRRARPEPG